MDESSVDGWLAPISESNGLFMRRATWELFGGLDERFDSPGGGIINLDTFRRAAELSDAELVVLLGEGTFHQLGARRRWGISKTRSLRPWMPPRRRDGTVAT